MKDNIDESLNNILGNRKNFTASEIDAALKRKKKSGGTILDNLTSLTGRTLPSTEDLLSTSMKLNERLDAFSDELRKYAQENETKHTASAPSSTAEKAVSSDKEVKSGKEETLSAQVKSDKAEVLNKEDALDAFSGVTDAVGKTVFGQDEFIKKLVVAFKRPYVMVPEEGMAKNAMYIFGASDTGKHLALNTLVEILAQRKIIAGNKPHFMDLSLYPNASEEKLFLQDLYVALSGRSEIIVFENFDKCHTSLLSRLSNLVIKGKCNLSERYTMSNGQLVNVSNALAKNTVSSFEASGKYLVFISSLKLSKLSDAMGAPFINALGDICETKPLSREALYKIVGKEKEELVKDALENARFMLTVEDSLTDYAVSFAESNAGLTNALDFFKDILKALSELRLNNDYPKNAAVKLSVADNVVTACIGDETINLLEALPGLYTGELDTVKKDMEEIVGLSEIKEYILSLEQYFDVQKKRRDAGLKAGEVNKHMIFTGNPGTGKTTIARIISRYLKAIGVLTGGQLVEVSRADLVGKYVGHTAPLTNQVIESAIGGVLFIDEAYSLYRGKDDTFGLEAIDTLVKGIEDNRDNLIVILAGYSTEMEEFLTANSGLKSRFPNIINFPDYTGEELLKIADITAHSKGYSIDEGVRDSLLAYFNAVQAKRAKDAGNGRLVRNKIEDAILNQSKRLVNEPDADLSALTSMDFDLSDI